MREDGGSGSREWEERRERKKGGGRREGGREKEPEPEEGAGRCSARRNTSNPQSPSGHCLFSLQPCLFLPLRLLSLQPHLFLHLRILSLPPRLRLLKSLQPGFFFSRVFLRYTSKMIPDLSKRGGDDAAFNGAAAAGIADLMQESRTCRIFAGVSSTYSAARRISRHSSPLSSRNSSP